MTYFVTYCASDQDVGANPLWHSSILLSQWKEDQDKVEVLHNWGFYGVPTTEKKNSWTGQFKVALGLDIDLTGNHGMFTVEDIRFYDRGRGLHGVSFELTQTQFELLRDQCTKMLVDQEAAIKEVVEPQGIKGKPEGEAKYYPHEEFSALIYKFEQIKAIQQGREPRLKPFEAHLSLGLWGPSLAGSKNCKTQSLSLLASVLSDKQIKRLTENGNHPTLPRYSGKMEDIYLHSTGPLREHKKKSGEIVRYRDGKKDDEVKLYWTIPPQELEVLSENTQELFQMDSEYCQRIKPLVKQLQSLEWLFQNAVVHASLQPYKTLLIQEIVDCYQCFSMINLREETKKISDWHAWGLSLFSVPKNGEELRLQKSIERAKTLLNSVYMAIVDDWEIFDNDEPDNLNSLEALAAYLPLKDKLNACKILGRSYCESQWSSDEETVAISM